MGTITDLTSLVTQLVDRIEDRKAAADLREVQRMIAVLQSEQAKLHEDNIELRTENADLKQRNASLQQQLARRQQTQSVETQYNDLDEITTKMLVLVSNSRQELTRDMVIHQLGLSKAKGEYHFKQISERKFVRMTHGKLGGSMFWGATPEGLKYLASRNLLE
jgi:predicted nuclease with TOPRIM domain